MKQVKLKSVDSGSDETVLNDQLMAVLKEISAFSSRMEEMGQRELILDFSPAFSHEQRLRDLRTKLLPGKEPAKPVIFLTRMVIECLNKGPLSEKEMKIIVLDRCKTLGIKSSNRGLIAGTGMDVATVCSVLHALGAVEPVDANNHPVGASAIKLETPAGAEESTAATVEDGCPEQLTGPAAELYALLSVRWRERLGEYIADAQKSREEAESTAAAPVPAAGSSSSGSSTLPAPNPLPGGGAAASVKSTTGVAVAAGGAGSTTAVKTAPPPPTGVATVTPAAAAVPSVSSTQSNSAISKVPTAAVPTSSSHSSSSSSAKVSADARTASAAVVPAAAPYFSIFAPPQSKQGTVAEPTHIPAVPSSSNNLSHSLGPSEPRATAASAVSTAPIPSPSVRSAAVDTAVNVSESVDTTATASAPAIPTAVPLSSSTAPPTNSVPQSLPATTIGGLGLRPVSSGPSNGASGPSFPTSANLVGIAQLPVASAASYVVPSNSFLSASAESQKQQLPPPAPPSAPAAPTTAVPESGTGTGTYTSVLSASGTPITIAAVAPNGTDTATTSSSSSKAGKTKTPKAPKPPSERKPTKKPSKPPADPLGAPTAAPAVAPTQTAGAGGSGSTNSNKARRGPSALRIWRLREEFVPYATQLTSSSAGSSNCTSSSSDASQLKAITIGNVQWSSSSKSSTTTAAPLNSTGSAETRPVSQHNNSSSNSNNATSSSSSNNSSNNSNLAMQLLLQPSIINTAAQADYTLQSALEVEEKLLRRLAGQCGITLKSSRFRVGTTYLSADPEIMTETFRSRFVQNSAQFPTFYNKTGAKLSNTSETNSEDYYRNAAVGESSEPKYTLYDESVHITSAYLLDKVRRTKRQRGDCLYGSITLPNNCSTSASVTAARNAAAASVGVFSPQHVHSLSAVCAKSQDYFWAASVAAAAASKNNLAKKKTPAPQNKASNDAITMGQYAYNLNMGIPSPSGVAPVVLSSCSNGSSITNYTLRRYALSLHLVDAHMPMLDPTKTTSLFAAAPSSSSSGKPRLPASSPGNREVVRIPDLSLHSREIAWTEIAQEFAVLAAPVDEPGALPTSASTLTLQDAASSDAASTTTTTAMKSKKRKHQQQSLGKTATTATLEDATQKLASIEVLAPQYKEITPVSDVVRQLRQQQQQQSTGVNNSDDKNGCENAFEAGQGSDSGDEDTSDEAVGRRHEAVLQAMRDKWNLLQQLKSEALYGPGGAPAAALGSNSSSSGGGGGYRSGGYGYYGGPTTSTSADATPTAVPAGDIPAAAALSVPVTTGTPNGGRFQNLSPRKRGLASAHLKRRGRPPKIAKYTGVAHTPIAAVSGTQPTPVGIAATAAAGGGSSGGTPH